MPPELLVRKEKVTIIKLLLIIKIINLMKLAELIQCHLIVDLLQEFQIVKIICSILIIGAQKMPLIKTSFLNEYRLMKVKTVYKNKIIILIIIPHKFNTTHFKRKIVVFYRK
jgi:hypothetical protein